MSDKKQYSPEEVAKMLLERLKKNIDNNQEVYEILAKAKNTAHEIEAGSEPKNDDAECPDSLCADGMSAGAEVEVSVSVSSEKSESSEDHEMEDTPLQGDDDSDYEEDEEDEEDEEEYSFKKAESGMYTVEYKRLAKEQVRDMVTGGILYDDDSYYWRKDPKTGKEELYEYRPKGARVTKINDKKKAKLQEMEEDPAGEKAKIYQSKVRQKNKERKKKEKNKRKLKEDISYRKKYPFFPKDDSDIGKCGDMKVAKAESGMFQVEYKRLVKKEKNRCWEGYEPVPGKEPYSKGSCQKKSEHMDKCGDMEKDEGEDKGMTVGKAVAMIMSDEHGVDDVMSKVPSAMKGKVLAALRGKDAKKAEMCKGYMEKCGEMKIAKSESGMYTVKYERLAKGKVIDMSTRDVLADEKGHYIKEDPKTGEKMVYNYKPKKEKKLSDKEIKRQQELKEDPVQTFLYQGKVKQKNKARKKKEDEMQTQMPSRKNFPKDDSDDIDKCGDMKVAKSEKPDAGQQSGGKQDQSFGSKVKGFFGVGKGEGQELEKAKVDEGKSDEEKKKARAERKKEAQEVADAPMGEAAEKRKQAAQHKKQAKDPKFAEKLADKKMNRKGKTINPSHQREREKKGGSEEWSKETKQMVDYDTRRVSRKDDQYNKIKEAVPRQQEAKAADKIKEAKSALRNQKRARQEKEAEGKGIKATKSEMDKCGEMKVMKSEKLAKFLKKKEMTELKKQADGMSARGFSPMSMNTPKAQAARQQAGVPDFNYGPSGYNQTSMKVPSSSGQGTTPFVTPQMRQKINQAQEQFNADYNKPAMAARTVDAFKQFGNTLNEMSGGGQQKPAAKDMAAEQKKAGNKYGIKNPYSSDAISNAKTFGQAFKQARKEIGAGGVFEYGGKKYNTYTQDEMKNMAAKGTGKGNKFFEDYNRRKDFTGSQDAPASERAYYANKQKPKDVDTSKLNTGKTAPAQKQGGVTEAQKIKMNRDWYEGKVDSSGMSQGMKDARDYNARIQRAKDTMYGGGKFGFKSPGGLGATARIGTTGTGKRDFGERPISPDLTRSEDSSIEKLKKHMGKTKTSKKEEV